MIRSGTSLLMASFLLSLHGRLWGLCFLLFIGIALFDSLNPSLDGLLLSGSLSMGG